MKKILILTNSLSGFFNFRKELINVLIKEGFEIYMSAPSDIKKNFFENKGIHLIETKIERRGINPLKDFRLLMGYFRFIKKIKPNLILSYTIKPNIYGGLAARFTKTQYIPNITGLGSAVENKGILRLITLTLYRIALKKAKVIFFQNKENMDFMNKHKINGKKSILLPGSGVNLEEFKYQDYPKDDIVHFLFVGRIMKAKGIDYYLEAAKFIKTKYPNTVFHVIGDYEEDYKATIESYERDNIIKYHGRTNDISRYQAISHAIIHPTFFEGMSNVLLESAASGRPIIASKIPGCIETFDEGISGLVFEVKNQESLNQTIETFLKLSYQDKMNMGIKGREKVEKAFDRTFIINEYMKVIHQI